MNERSIFIAALEKDDPADRAAFLDQACAGDRLLLLGDEDQAHTAFADLLHELVRADDRAGPFGDRRFIDGRTKSRGAMFEKAVAGLVGLEQPLDPLAQRPIFGARLVEVGGPFGGIIFFQGSNEDGSFAHGRPSRSEIEPLAAPLGPRRPHGTLLLNAPSAGKSRQKNGGTS